MLAVAQQTKVVSTCKRCLSNVTSVLGEYIPTFRFGVLSTARALSISINPAENQRNTRPLPLLPEYSIVDRSELSGEALADIERRSDEYFANGSKHSFFSKLASIVSRMDPALRYEDGSLSHMDVVACVTRPTWASVPAQERQNMLKSCREHFLATLRLLPSGALLFCDGRTALQAIEDAGGVTEITEHVKGNLIVFIGTLPIGTNVHTYVGWNHPAHKLYASPSEVARAVKRLLKGNPDENGVQMVTQPLDSSSLSPPIIGDGQSFGNQRDLMRLLVKTLGYDEDAVCPEYASAERRGLVPRSRNNHGLSPEQYAHRLYADGIRKGWLLSA